MEDVLYNFDKAIPDTTSATHAFESYLEHLETNELYPIYSWHMLSYERSNGHMKYNNRSYWGIVAWGTHVDGDTTETIQFHVRTDGYVVSLLGCI